MNRLIRNSSLVTMCLLMYLFSPYAFAQDTIYVKGMGMMIILNNTGTFLCTHEVHLHEGGYMVSHSYGEYFVLDDSTISFTSSTNTRQEILDYYCYNDTSLPSDCRVVSVYDEQWNLLCKMEGERINHYGKNTIFRIVVDDTAITLWGISPYGQWSLSAKNENISANYHSIILRDAYVYQLEYLHFTARRIRSGNRKMYEIISMD